MGLIAPWYVESPPYGELNLWHILNHWTAREIPVVISYGQKSLKTYFHICKIGLKNSVYLLGLL